MTPYYKNLPKKPRVSIVSLGCSKNTVDSENLIGRIHNADFDVVSDPEDADAVIINTCGFIEPAILETKSTISEMAGLKKTAPEKKIIVMGCYISRGVEDWEKNYPALDGVFSLTQTEKIVPHLQKILNHTSSRQRKDHPYFRTISTTLPHYAYLKIAEGCSRTCTFCTIPSIRGPNTSKSIDDLRKEAEFLTRRGAREIIIIAQDTTAYGIDIYGKPMLAELLKELVLVDAIEWIRLLYVYPDHIADDLPEILLNEEKILHYLDLPIQHAHPETLKRMSRSGTFETYDRLFGKLRQGDPDYSLRTTIMAGFPQETEEEFNQNLRYIKHIKFDRLGAFKYMEEKGTPSVKIKGLIADNIKNERFEKIMLTQQKNHFSKNESLVGKKQRTIIDSKEAEGFYKGRTYRDAPDIDAAIFIKTRRHLKPGDIVNAEVTGVKEYDLEGAL